MTDQEQTASLVQETVDSYSYSYSVSVYPVYTYAGLVQIAIGANWWAISLYAVTFIVGIPHTRC